jgi:hypothetical protein
MSEHRHQFTFLRQEKRNEGYDRNPRWVYYDVFFCEECLEYRFEKVKETRDSRQFFGEEVVWERPR